MAVLPSKFVVHGDDFHKLMSHDFDNVHMNVFVHMWTITDVGVGPNLLQREPGVSDVKTIEDGNIELSWVYKGTYWDAREKQNWEDCPDIM